MKLRGRVLSTKMSRILAEVRELCYSAEHTKGNFRGKRKVSFSVASSPYLIERGIILRETPTRESDKILTLLTEHHGKCAVIARGARRGRCHFAAAAQPLVYAEWTLYHRGNWYYVRDAETMELFDGIRRDLNRLSLGFYFAELTESVAVEETPSGELLRHLLNGLYTLSVTAQVPVISAQPPQSPVTAQSPNTAQSPVTAQSPDITVQFSTAAQSPDILSPSPAGTSKPLELIKAAFEIKLLSHAGFEPLVHACALCGNPEPDEPVWNVTDGVILCQQCAARTGADISAALPDNSRKDSPSSFPDGLRENSPSSLPDGFRKDFPPALPDGSRKIYKPLCRDSLSALRHIVYGDAKRLYAFRLGRVPLARLSDAAEIFLSAQLERSFRTLDFYHSIRKQENPYE